MTTSPYRLSLEGHSQQRPQNPCGPGSFLLVLSNPELRFPESDGLCRNPRIGPLTPVFATDPRNRPLTPIIATDPKNPSRNSFVCHTCDTPRGRSLTLLLLKLEHTAVGRRFRPGRKGLFVKNSNDLRRLPWCPASAAGACGDFSLLRSPPLSAHYPLLTTHCPPLRRTTQEKRTGRAARSGSGRVRGSGSRKG